MRFNPGVSQMILTTVNLLGTAALLLFASNSISALLVRGNHATAFKSRSHFGLSNHCAIAGQSIRSHGYLGYVSYATSSSSDYATEEYIPPLTQEPPLKILLLVEPTPFNYISGYANRFKEMLKYLHKAGDEVVIITPDKDRSHPTEYLSYKIHCPRGWEFPLYQDITLTFDFKGKVNEIIKEFKPDLIHASTPSAIQNPATLWAAVHDIPLVLSYHTDFPGYAKAYAKFPGSVALAYFLMWIYHTPADLVLCTSPQLKEDMQSVNINRIDVWRKGINTEIFNPSYRSLETRKELSPEDPEAPILLYVGRLGFEKKLHRLKAVLDKHPEARLVLVGSGPAENSLRDLFKDSNVVFTGKMTGEPLSKVYASADIFTMTSDTETLGFVVIEALASGIPVVGVAAGGVLDIIEHERTGFLAENNEDGLDFARHVGSLIDDVTMRKRMGQHGAQWAQKWSWETATSKLRNIQYRKAIALHQTRDEKRRHVKDIADAVFNAPYRPTRGFIDSDVAADGSSSSSSEIQRSGPSAISGTTTAIAGDAIL